MTLPHAPTPIPSLFRVISPSVTPAPTIAVVDVSKATDPLVNGLKGSFLSIFQWFPIHHLPFWLIPAIVSIAAILLILFIYLNFIK